MNYKEAGFRAVFHNFCAFPLNEKLQKMIDGFPGAEDANCLLAYGFIDQEEGVLMEVICSGHEEDLSFQFCDTDPMIQSRIHIEDVAEDEFYYIEDDGNQLRNRYMRKLNQIDAYDVTDDVTQTRLMEFLDDLRHPYFPDDIQVQLVGNGREVEVCWARITGMDEENLWGTLLNEPDQDFGFYCGDTIAITVQKTDDGKAVCISEGVENYQFSAEDFEDGSLLKDAIDIFNLENSEEHFAAVLEILRDSKLWVPYHEEVYPDLLQSGENEYYLPVFSSVEEMGEYGKVFTPVRKHFLEAAELTAEHEIAGIVVNPFTGPFAFDHELIDLIKSIESMIEE